MAKITSYVEKTNPNGETDYFVIAYGGQNYKVKMSNGAFWAERYRQKPAVTDLVGGSEAQAAPFTVFTNSLSVVQIASEDNHAGIWQISGSGGGDAAGFSLGIENTLIGGETVEAVFRVLDDLLIMNIGLMGFSVLTPLGPNDPGVFLNIDSALRLTGITLLGDAFITQSSTSTSYTLTSHTWYRAKLVVGSGVGRVDFYLYSDDGILLWSDFLTTNIPSTAGPYVFLADGLGGSELSADVDWLAYYNANDLTR